LFVSSLWARINLLLTRELLTRLVLPQQALQGNIGGEKDAEALMSGETRDRRMKVWWAFAHDVLQLLRNVVPSSVGHVRDRTQATMERWYKFMHESGCRSFVSVLPLGESAHVDEAVGVAKMWPAILAADSSAGSDLHESLLEAVRDPRGFRIIQELLAPPLTWSDTPWMDSHVNLIGDSVFYLGTNHKGAHNLLIEALAMELREFEVGFFECLCAQGSWEIAYELARRTCICANIRLNPGMSLPPLCRLLDTIEDASIDECVIVCWQGNDHTNTYQRSRTPRSWLGPPTKETKVTFQSIVAS
jgi:hypothetical protein